MPIAFPLFQFKLICDYLNEIESNQPQDKGKAPTCHEADLRLYFGLKISDEELRSKLQCDKETSKRVSVSLISTNTNK